MSPNGVTHVPGQNIKPGDDNREIRDENRHGRRHPTGVTLI
jgi:hypothetical protein